MADKKTKTVFVAVICILFAGAFLVFSDRRAKEVCFGDNCFLVELAQTSEELSQGLMHKESLAQDRGMLFIFPASGVYNFWMKNTKIPLDMIWINDKREVVFIKNNAQPCMENVCPSMGPGVEAIYVLEINAGLAEKIGIKTQSRVTFKNFSY